MKLALISPKGAFYSNNPEMVEFWNSSRELTSLKSFWAGTSSAMLLLASLTPENYELDIIDENYEQIDFNKRFDIVAIGGYTQQVNRAYEIAKEFRSKGTFVVMGGYHATILPDEVSKHADTVIVGEGELLWPQFLKDFENGCPKKKYETDQLFDLKDSPIPRYDLLKKYDSKIIWLQTTRGCPHDCEFCAASKIYGKKYRIKPVEKIISEIEYIKQLFPFTKIGFSDDNLFVNRKKSKQLLEKIIPLKIRWVGQSDISVAEDQELLKLVKDSGCISLFIGFESVNQANLKKLDNENWKYKQYSRYKENIHSIQSHGIGVIGAFILGMDEDDSTVFEKTLQFIENNHLYSAQLSILTPYPGTRLMARFEDEKRILTKNWEQYTMANAIFKHPNLTKEQLESGLLNVYKRVYSKEFVENTLLYFKEMQKAARSRDGEMSK